jgi:hypothetical protein
MQEASFTGLLRTLLYIFFFYYLFKFLFRLFFPMMMNHTMRKMEERFRQQQSAQEPHRKTGETVIDKKPKSDSSNSKIEGEYIDYEEVD